MTPVEAHAVTITIETRVAVLRDQRHRDRKDPRSADWSPARHDREVELRALIALLRTGRRLARQVEERLDPVTMAGAYADWTSGELVAGFGR